MTDEGSSLAQQDTLRQQISTQCRLLFLPHQSKSIYIYVLPNLSVQCSIHFSSHKINNWKSIRIYALRKHVLLCHMSALFIEPGFFPEKIKYSGVMYGK